ncbi:hypothetical protein PSAC2689_190055 [Paraburkholderia sacchari]
MAQFQGQDIIEIVRGGSCLRVAPQAGGRLLSYICMARRSFTGPMRPTGASPRWCAAETRFCFLSSPAIAWTGVSDYGAMRRAGCVKCRCMVSRDLPFEAQVDAPWYTVTSWTLAPDSDFYCVELWLGLPDAIHSGLGLRWLEPVQTEEASLRISVSALD